MTVLKDSTLTYQQYKVAKLTLLLMATSPSGCLFDASSHNCLNTSGGSDTPMLSNTSLISSSDLDWKKSFSYTPLLEYIEGCITPHASDSSP